MPTPNKAVIGLAVAIGMILILAPSAIAASSSQGPPVGGKRCGGFAGIPCPDNLQCVDDPRDDCDPRAGDADCIGICRPAGGSEAAADALDPAAVEEFLAGLDAEAAELTRDGTNAEPVAGQGQGRGCKPCKRDRRWCGCTYNGLPRASCDPCCYTNDIGLLICLD